MHCPSCNSTKIIKYGKRQTKIGNKQVYECKSCRKFFIEPFITKKHYSTKIIFKAISLYNLGNSISQTQKIIAKQHNKTIPISTIHNWIKTNEICTFTKLRKKLKLQKPIKQKLFQHHQPYLMRIHKTKLKLTKNYKLQKYIKHITNYNININKLTQCSEASKKYKKKLLTKPIKHEAIEFTKIAIDISQNNKDRHTILQNLMLTNDKATIATELPIYNKKYIGHIDILQYKHPYFEILEYKPIINNQCFNQVRLYKYLLKNNLNIDYKNIKAFIFNEYECYQIESFKYK